MMTNPNMFQVGMMLVFAFISGCISPGYECPLNAQPGTCTSQGIAYSTSYCKLTGDSIFKKPYLINRLLSKLRRHDTIHEGSCFEAKQEVLLEPMDVA